MKTNLFVCVNCARKAFTLAEVLITLAIIGIIAAISIPSVISNYQQQEFKTGLKKAVSVLNEAIQAGIAFDGMSPYDCTKEYPLFKYLQNHMSVIKSTNDVSTFYYVKTPWALDSNSGNYNTNKVFIQRMACVMKSMQAIQAL